MTLEITRQQNTLKFDGELNRDTLMMYSPFKLSNGISGTLVFDFSSLSNIDTAGLAWLLQQLAQAKDRGQTITLCNVPKQLVSLADVTAVTPLLPISD